MNAPEYEGSAIYLNLILEKNGAIWDYTEIKEPTVELFTTDIEFKIDGKTQAIEIFFSPQNNLLVQVRLSGGLKEGTEYDITATKINAGRLALKTLDDGSLST
jgi:hypothetical protein